MSKQETLADLITNETTSKPKGEKVLKSNYNDWNIETLAEWNSKKINLRISARVPKFHITFENCIIKKAKIISIITRYDNFKIRGKSSSISDLLLSDPIAKNLLKGGNARFELSDKNLIYNVKLKRQDKTSLINVFILIEKLTEKIDMII
ncbi:hypothetical protein [Ulvibacter litoralis]|uniref:Uncharacterized protein n=1 Tax=Ulvibacter litoralis TaxID=227084 RepID=A0A1G7K044_9FLAO|nr:hypothetical protein [Ulvibacter litoralis]GHC66282.1 hypothetical protein GCM10008083_34080 [Ulvibacter litoralis]SDF30606.1 hypothetical protein SAMN05421855_1412 [Ulvibacter litoralis]